MDGAVWRAEEPAAHGRVRVTLTVRHTDPHEEHGSRDDNAEPPGAVRAVRTALPLASPLAERRPPHKATGLTERRAPRPGRGAGGPDAGSPAAGPAALTPQACRVPPGARATTAHASPCSPEVRPPPGTEQAPGPHPPRPTQASGPVRGHRDVHGAPLENQLRESAGTSRVVTSAPRPHGAAAA